MNSWTRLNVGIQSLWTGSLVVANACVVLLLRPRTINTSQPADAPAAVSTVANLIMKPGTTSADTHRIPDATASAG